jgi:hypothetical protein
MNAGETPAESFYGGSSHHKRRKAAAKAVRYAEFSGLFNDDDDDAGAEKQGAWAGTMLDPLVGRSGGNDGGCKNDSGGGADAVPPQPPPTRHKSPRQKQKTREPV